MPCYVSIGEDANELLLIVVKPREGDENSLEEKRPTELVSDELFDDRIERIVSNYLVVNELGRLIYKCLTWVGREVVLNQLYEKITKQN